MNDTTSITPTVGTTPAKSSKAVMQTPTLKPAEITDKDVDQAQKEAALKQELVDAMQKLKLAQDNQQECIKQAKATDEAAKKANANFTREQTEEAKACKDEAEAEKARRIIEQQIADSQAQYYRLSLDYLKLNQKELTKDNTQAQAAKEEAIKALDSALDAVDKQQKTLSGLMSKLTEALAIERNLENVEATAIKELAAARATSEQATKAAQTAQMKAQTAHTDALRMQAIVAVADAKNKLQTFMKEETSSAKNFFYACLLICSLTIAWTLFNVCQTEKNAGEVHVLNKSIESMFDVITEKDEQIKGIATNISSTSLDVSAKAAQATEALALIQTSQQQLEEMRKSIQIMEADVKKSMKDMDAYNLTVLQNKTEAAKRKMDQEVEQTKNKYDELVKALEAAKQRADQSAAIVSAQESMVSMLQNTLAASTTVEQQLEPEPEPATTV